MVLDIGQTYCCQKNLFLFSALPIILDIKIARAKVGEISVQESIHMVLLTILKPFHRPYMYERKLLLYTVGAAYCNHG